MSLNVIKNYALAKKYPMASNKYAAVVASYNATTPYPFSGLTFLHQVIPATYPLAGGGGTTGCSTSIGSGWYDFFGVYSNGYDGMTPWTVPVIATGKKQKLSDLAASITAGKYYYQLAAYPTGTGLHATIASAPMAAADFLAAYGNKVLVTEMILLDDSIDGQVTSGNQRTKLGRINYGENIDPPGYSDVFARFWANQRSTDIGDIDILVPLYRTFIAANLTTAPQGETFNQNSRLAMEVLAAETIGFAEYTNGTLALGSIIPNQNIRYFKLWDEAALNAAMNAIGIPFTWSAYEAQWRNKADWDETGGWIPTGQEQDDTGGGEGTGDNTSDDITEVDPDVSVISTFNKHYACTAAQLGDLGNYLWNSTFLDNIKLLFNDPMEGVVSCRLFPFNLAMHDGSHVGALSPIMIGNVVTDASGYPLANGYNARFDLGSLSIDEYYGSAMDYEPYTTLAIYLPYIGIKDLSTNDFMGRTLSVKYIVDITTGSCIAQVWADEQLLYTYDGHIGVEVPISSTNAAQFASGLAMTGLAAIGGFAASGGNALAAAGTVLATAKGVASNQFHINKGGANSPFAGFYMPQYPYVIINRPIQSLASTFGATYGYPSNVSRKLSTLTGFTQIDEVQLNGVNATMDELNELERILKEGFIL
jgi:hypothetical protein